MSDDKRLERMESKLDKLTDIQSEMKVDLALHIEGVKQTRELIALKEKEMETKMAPVIEHVEKIETWITIGKALGIAIAKIIGAAVVAVGAVEGIVTILEYLKK
jgi:hypothetical protein